MAYFLESITNTPIVLIAIYALVVLCFVYLLDLFVMYLVKSYRNRSKKTTEIKLDREINNPILKPLSYRGWENVATFNPGAVKDDEGFVHLLYRAIGGNGLSTIGHAKSKDGINFYDRSAYPVYVSAPTKEKKFDEKTGEKKPRVYNLSIYTSGGGWGGCEDPRLVAIDGRVYMTYTAFEGWDSVRIGLTSISMEDLKKDKWNWKKPKLLSPPGSVNKNWVIFPEKINGKFAILHSVVPEIMVEYVDSLDDFIGYIDSPRPQGPQPGREDHWDNIMRGSGTPPIKTDIGWLLLYHAIDKNEWNRYKVGAMILDINNPTKILYRSPEPILEPDMPYENEAKEGVVYATGAIVMKDDLFVYYGGGDKNVCVAKTPLQPLLDWLVNSGKV